MKLLPALSVVLLVVFAGCNARATSERDRTAVDLLAPETVRFEAETRRIRFGRGDRTPLAEGWTKDRWDAGFERPIVWAVAERATVRLRLLETSDLQFLVNVSPHPVALPQKVSVLANDRPVADLELRPGFYEYRFVVPGAALRRGENRLTFAHSRLSEERRRDGLHFAAEYTDLLFGPQCAPLRPRGDPPDPGGRWSRSDGSRSVEVIGPADVTLPLHVPDRGGRLRLAVSVPRLSAGPAKIVLGVATAEGSASLAHARISRPFFGSKSRRELDADLTPWRGMDVTVRVSVRTDRCRSGTARATVERLLLLPPAGEAG